jgi:hypothetical protein
MKKGALNAVDCGPLQAAHGDHKIIIKKLATLPVPDSPDVHTIYFIQILSSLRKSPCSYLRTTDSKCHKIREKVVSDGEVWDWYLLNCPHGPPCLFLEGF